MKIIFSLFLCLISSVCLADWTVDKCWVTNDIGIATNPNISYLCAHIVNFPNFEKDYDKICLIDNITGKEVGDFWGKKDNADTVIYEIDKNKKIDLSNLQLKFAEIKVKIEVAGISRPVITVPKEIYQRPITVVQEVNEPSYVVKSRDVYINDNDNDYIVYDNVPHNLIVRDNLVNSDYVVHNNHRTNIKHIGGGSGSNDTDIVCDDDITIDDPGNAIARTVGINPDKGNGKKSGSGSGFGKGLSKGSEKCDDVKGEREDKIKAKEDAKGEDKTKEDAKGEDKAKEDAKGEGEGEEEGEGCDGLGNGNGSGSGVGPGSGPGGGCPCSGPYAMTPNPYGNYTPYPKNPEVLKIPLPKIKNPLTTGFILYLSTGDVTSEGIVYQVDDTGRVMGKVKLPNTAMGISMHRDNALMLSVPRDGGKILRINDIGKVEAPILEKNKLLPCPTKIYLPKNSDIAVIYDDITKELLETNYNGKSPKKFNGENPFVSIMDSNTGNVAIARDINKIDIKLGDKVIKTLTLPSDKTFYKDGLMSWSGVGTLCVTCNGEDGIPWLIMYDIDKNKVKTLFPWKTDLQGIAIGPRMKWDYNAKSDYKSTF